MTTTPLYRSLLLLLSLSFFLNSCKKDIDKFISEEEIIIGSSTWTGTVDGVLNAISSESLLYTLESPSIISFETPALSRFDLPGNALMNAEGVVAQGNVQATILEVLNKGNMIRNRISTTANNLPIDLSAAFFVDIQQGGQSLQVSTEANLLITFPAENFNNQEELFYGSNGAVIWEEASIDGEQNVWPATIYDEVQDLDLSGYSAYSDLFSWLAIGHYLMDEMEEGYEILVNLPIGLTSQNTLVYLVFESYNTVIELQPDLNEKSFWTQNIPGDEPALILTISELQEGQLLVKQQNFITKNYNLDISIIQPQAVSVEGLNELLDNL